MRKCVISLFVLALDFRFVLWYYPVMAKKTTNPIESDFSAAVQDAFGGWCQRVERGRVVKIFAQGIRFRRVLMKDVQVQLVRPPIAIGLRLGIGRRAVG